MRVRRTVLVCLVCLFSLGAAGGVAAVLRTIGIYSGACEKLSGFPGLLQAAAFVPAGNCQFVSSNNKKTCPSNSCTVDGKKGKCTQETSGSQQVCVCRVQTTSR